MKIWEFLFFNWKKIWKDLKEKAEFFNMLNIEI